MNIFDPNESVNEEKYLYVCIGQKKIYMSICALCTCIKINYKNI